ncbi:acylphosphatase [Halobacillus sp. A5]|uniref:acylphosphatase n=1 Tax=Halobacillus sp. A5 TaxID=2880263 RepID=UPI0020A6C952|nr:acylphosphatase [Halobacillus sp. A5]MCP3025928.1 acylphosphatase [Halobacillus sp. A5]
MARKHLVFHGQVQGVGFRATAQSLAKQYGLTGWVKNKEDGTVELEAEGSAQDLQSFTREIKEGPSPFIKIKAVEEDDYDEEKGHRKFKVIY